MCDVIWDAIQLDRNCLMIFADYKRAIVSLSNDSIFEVVKLFNFYSDMFRRVKVMLRGAVSSVARNKTKTDFFPINQC